MILLFLIIVFAVILSPVTLLVNMSAMSFLTKGTFNKGMIIFLTLFALVFAILWKVGVIELLL